MKVWIDGYRGPFNATERIEKEFLKLGHVLTEDSPDLIYHVNGLFEKAEDIYQKNSHNSPIRLYNLLDLNNSDPNFYNSNVPYILNCEIFSVISNVVKQQAKRKLKLKRDIKILPYPIRPISPKLNYQRGIPFLYVGRVYSENKRFGLIQETLDLMGFDKDNLVVAGTEKPPFGLWVDKPDDLLLSELYNSAEFTFLPSSIEGQGCTVIEAAIAGSFPILCCDNPMAHELGLTEFSTLPDSRYLALKINDIKNNSDYYNELLDSRRPFFLENFTLENVVRHVMRFYNEYKLDF